MADDQPAPSATPVPQSQTHAPTPTRRRLPRWLRRCLIVVAVLFLLLAAAPYVIAPLWGPGILASLADGSIKGSLRADSLSIPWFGAVEIRGLSLRDPDGRTVLHVASARLDRGLLRAALSGGNFGQLDIRQPHATLYRTSAGRYSIQDAVESRRPKGPPKEEKPSRASGRLLLSGGAVDVFALDGTRLAVGDLAVDLRLNGMEDIRLTFSADAGSAGAFHGSADLRAAGPEAAFDPASMSGSLALATDKPINILQLAPLTGRGSLMGRASVNLKAAFDKGRFDSSLALVLADASTIGVSQVPPRPLNLTLEADLAGTTAGFEGRATLAGDLRAATLTVKAASPARVVSAADAFDAFLHGRAVSLPDALVTLVGELDLARLAQAVPTLVNVRHDVLLKSGTLSFRDIRLQGGEKPSLAGRIDLSDVDARVAGQPVQWESMFFAWALSTDPQGRLNFDRADVNLGEVALQARGGPADLSVAAHGDLGALHARLGRLFDLSAFSLSGTFGLTASVRRAEVPAAGSADRPLRLAVDLDLHTDALTYTRRERPVSDLVLTSRLHWVFDLLKTSSEVSARGTGILTGLDATIRGDRARLDRLVFEHDAAYDRPAGRLTLAKANVASDAFDLAAAGRLDFLTPDAPIDLSGAYALRWDKLTPLLHQLDDRTPSNFKALKTFSGKFALLRKPNSIQASLDASGEVGRLALSAVAPDLRALQDLDLAPLLDAACRGEPLPALPEAQFTLDGLLHMDRLAPATPDAARRADWPWPVEGQLEFRNLILRGGRTPVLSGEVALSRAAVEFEGQSAPFGNLLLKADLALESDRRLKANALGLTAPGLTTSLSGTPTAVTVKADADLTTVSNLYGRWLALPATFRGAASLTGSVRRGQSADKSAQAELSLALDHAVFRRTDSAAAPAQFTAGVAYKGKLDWSGGLASSGVLTARNLLIQAGTIRHEQPLLTLQHDLQADSAGQLLTLRSLQLTSQPEWIYMDAHGSVKQWRGAPDLDLAGTYAGDWDQVCAILKAVDPSLRVPEDYILHGPTREPFRLAGPPSDLKLFSASSAVSWKGARALGVDVSAARIPSTMAGGIITVPLTELSAAGGFARLAATLDVRGPHPVLDLPPNLQLLQRVHVSTEFGRKVLPSFIPVFANVGALEANASLRFTSLHAVLASGPAADAVGAGRLELADARFKPAGLLAQLLPLLGAPAKAEYPLRLTPLDFRLRNRGLEYEGLRLVIDNTFDMEFSGRVGFDGSVRVVVSLPVSEALLRKLKVPGPITDYARLLKSARVRIPIVGTTGDPAIDWNGVDIKPLLKQAGDALLKEQAGKFLRP